MTNKEYVLDCLADGFETAELVRHMLSSEEIKLDLSLQEVEKILKELTMNGMVCAKIDREKNEWYGMTVKGRQAWEQMK